MSNIYKGTLNGPIMGIVVKEIVRRALVAIRNQQRTFEVTKKDGYEGGSMDDVFTTADIAAQAIYLRVLHECFPDYGIVAEEGSLNIQGSNGCTSYFTIDPIDGTRAFIRGQTHGVSTMIALVEDGVVTCAFIGDLNAEVVYGFRPDSNNVHKISRLDVTEALAYRAPLVKSEAYALLRNPLRAYSGNSRRLMEDQTIFEGYYIGGGSIGVLVSRIWGREVQAIFLPPSWETPWDSSPVIGISQKLGYIFMKPKPTGFGWERYLPRIAKEKYWREHDTLIIHENDLTILGSCV